MSSSFDSAARVNCPKLGVEFSFARIKLAGFFSSDTNEVRKSSKRSKREIEPDYLEIEIEGVIGVGTGLALHRYTGEGAGEDSQVYYDADGVVSTPVQGYILTQLASGRSLGNRTVETIRQARL